MDMVLPDHFNAAAYFVDRNLAEGRGQNLAVLCGDQRFTYQEIAEGVNRAGNAFRALGLEEEQRVLILALDCPELVLAFWGAMKIGAVPVPVNTLLKPHDYEYLLQDSRARILVVSAELLPGVAGILSHCPGLRHVLVIGGAPGYPALADLLAAASPELEAADTSKDDVAFWLYTSGTTGHARAAVHLHHDMVVCTELYAKPILGISQHDRTFSVAKLFFAYGLGNALYFPFAVGASTVLLPGRPEPAAVFEVVRRHRPTLFYGVPTAYAAMLRAAEHDPAADFSSVRLAVSAGEPLPPSIYHRWLERFGVEILDGIGSTEILHIFISNRAGEVRPGSTGRVVPGYEAKLVDDDGQPVPEGEIGNLMVAGDSICAYYWNQHASNRWAFQGEWIKTGDKYHRDADGFYWYDGRRDDMLKVGGIWVSPVEVESVVMEHPAVLECAVVGAPDEAGLIKPRAYVVLKEGQGDEALARELQAFVKGRIAPYKYPRWIEFVAELPKTATGKIQRFKLREQPAPV